MSAIDFADHWHFALRLVFETRMITRIVSRAPIGRTVERILRDEALAMNRYERRPTAASEAHLLYQDGDYRVLRPGLFVLCAVTGVQIPLDELRYWSVERQEAYATPLASMARTGGRAP